MSFKIKFGNFLYHNAFPVYRKLYASFKNRQDKFEMELIGRQLKRGDVVLDIGANIGFYSVLLSELVGQKGRVHSFEPEEKNFRHLRAATSGRANIVTINKAVSNASGTLKIFTSKELNVDHRTYKPASYAREIEISCISIDDYIMSLPPKERKVDFIKMDIQGYEMMALKGMQRTLHHNKNIRILSEFWPYGLRSAGGSAIEYYRQLQRAGLRIFLLKDNALVLLTPEMVKEMQQLGKEHYFNIYASFNV